jgi:hypothetical protein
MALIIRPQREPFARVEGTAEIVRGPAFWRLRASLEKYCRGRTLGRSIVISGNRGIGKTTMVLAALEDLRRQCHLERGAPLRKGEEPVKALEEGRLRRPLFVSLSGPDIMRERLRAHPTPPRTSSGAKDGDKREGAAPVVEAPAPTTPGMADRVEDADNLLRQIARALHIAIAREFSESFVETLPRNGNAEWLEAGAQLQIELQSGAKVAALRRFWDLTDRLSSGVLFERWLGLPPSVGWDRQGLVELVALDVSADAYRIAIGKIEEDSLTQTDTDSREDEKGSWSDEVKSLVAPFAGLLGGAATGFGVFQGLGESADGLTRALGSIGAALLSSLLLTFSLSPKRTSTAESKVRFSRDNGVGSLVWRLGGIVDRLFEAGLAPVFVIDELDKVTLERDLGTWIERRAQELKSLLTERSFFCFLTGRGLAEKLHRERTLRTYPPSYTQFSNYLFVNYLPSDLHRYIRRILEQRPTQDPATQEHEDRQAAILPYVLLFRAEMHPIDIQRELNSLILKDDEIELYPPGRGVPRADAFAFLLQIAVEAVLSDDQIQRRMREDPRFALLAVDAVYYAPRKWRTGNDLDISQAAIDSYLNQRRTPDDRANGVEAVEATA